MHDWENGEDNSAHLTERDQHLAAMQDLTAAMATQNLQRDDGAPAAADVTQTSIETMQESCLADDCDSDQVYYKMMLKPGGSYEVRLFTCVKCGHKWRES